MTKALRAAMGVVLVTVPLFAALPAAPAEQRPTPEVRLPAQRPAAPPKPSAETVSRGQLLHENHCTTCHESVVHIRSDRRAKSLKALEGWVAHWASEQKLGWGPEEIGDVVEYLNRRYYKFPPPTGGK